MPHSTTTKRCTLCKKLLLAESFAKRSRKSDKLTSACRKCRYLHYRKRAAERVPDDDRKFNAIARALAARERNRGVKPCLQLTCEQVRELVIRRFGLRSSQSNRQIELKDATLVRKRDNEPFNMHTNCMLLSKPEMRRRVAIASLELKPAS